MSLEPSIVAMWTYDKDKYWLIYDEIYQSCAIYDHEVQGFVQIDVDEEVTSLIKKNMLEAGVPQKTMADIVKKLKSPIPIEYYGSPEDYDRALEDGARNMSLDEILSYIQAKDSEDKK